MKNQKNKPVPLEIIVIEDEEIIKYIESVVHIREDLKRILKRPAC